MSFCVSAYFSFNRKLPQYGAHYNHSVKWATRIVIAISEHLINMRARLIFRRDVSVCKHREENKAPRSTEAFYRMLLSSTQIMWWYILPFPYCICAYLRYHHKHIIIPINAPISKYQNLRNRYQAVEGVEDPCLKLANAGNTIYRKYAVKILQIRMSLSSYETQRQANLL